MNLNIQLEEIDTQDWQQKIGGGGGSLVYKGLWHGTPVALKRWFDQNAETSLADFNRETMTHAALAHPHIVQYLGACRQPPNLIMVTELVNYSLHDLLYDARLAPTVTRERLLDMALQICHAFRYLHSRCPAVIHRDIKPGNFLVDRAFRVKVCDFGLASATANQRQAGTPAYMAPELLDPSKPYSRAVDVYAFGVMLNEMFSRVAPFSNYAPSEVVTRVLSGARPTLDTSRVPSDLQPLIQKCWHESPDQRPSFEVIGNELKAFIASKTAA